MPVEGVLQEAYRVYRSYVDEGQSREVARGCTLVWATSACVPQVGDFRIDPSGRLSLTMSDDRRLMNSSTPLLFI